MDNEAVAEILEEIGMLLEIMGENPFKTRAYTNGARAIENLGEPLSELIAADRLKDIKGFGKALQEKVTALVTTGKLEYYDKLKASVPPGLIEMIDIPGLGPKKIRAVANDLEVVTIEGLEEACQDGSLAELKGFGKKTAEKILAGIEFRRQFSDRHRLDVACRLSAMVVAGLREHPDVTRCEHAGSLRRWKETVGDLDFVVSSKNPLPVLDWFVAQDHVMNVIVKGDTKASVNFEGGVQGDLRVVTDDEYPFALAYFTGSKEHNIVMRQRAIERGLRLNEYGLFKSKEETRDPDLRVDCRTEEEIFKALDLTFIQPELREGRGEFESAETGNLPRLMEWTDLKGSLHNHSDWSDGRQTLAEVAASAQEIGCSYWAITDHSRSSFIANGLDEKRLEKQLDAVAKVNEDFGKDGDEFRLLSGSEVDILSGGKLDFEDDLLARLDVVVASIHQGFGGSEEEMTKRMIRAVENPYVHTMGHITGRLLLERDAYALNQRKIIDACAANGTWIELNASPYRMDMDWRLWHHAKDKRVKCVINCDAHRFEHFGYLRLGAGVARKGWLTKDDVINTLPLDKLREALASKRGG